MQNNYDYIEDIFNTKLEKAKESIKIKEDIEKLENLKNEYIKRVIVDNEQTTITQYYFNKLFSGIH